jgi:hypothetical protein
MDVNGLRFWQAATASGFGLDRPGTSQNLSWDHESRTVRLSRQQSAPVVAEDRPFATARANQPSPVSDAGGSFAWWDGSTQTLRAAGFGIGNNPLILPPDIPPGVIQPTDLAFGDDDILYVARNGGVVMHDRRDRWPDMRVELAGFSADRLAPMPGGGVWTLDRSTGQIAILKGRPLRRSAIVDETDIGFEPVEPNPAPPQLQLLRLARLPADCEGIAIAGSRGGQLAVLAWRAGEDAILFLLKDRKLVPFGPLAGLQYPYSLAWDGETGVAIMVSEGASPARQAFVYEVADCPAPGSGALPSSAIRPFLDTWHGGFCNRLNDIPEYLTAIKATDSPTALRRLIALSRAGYATSGRLTFGPFDAGSAGFTWHRLYLEASIPTNCGARLWLHADDHDAQPPAPASAVEGSQNWFPHGVGVLADSGDFPDAPHAAWCNEPSELPHAPPMLSCPAAVGTSGLFTMLVQRSGRRVRRLTGRWLWLHIELSGDGQSTPDIAAVRLYGERFAYRDRYLPAFYRETKSGAEANEAGAATPNDFLDRFLSMFEGPFTQMEAKIADSWLLTDAGAVPEASLGWLGSWIGVDDDRRETLRAAPWTAGLHGTVGGLLSALELETGGRLVFGGHIDPQDVVPRPGQLALATLEGVTTRVLVLGVSDPRSGKPLAVLAGGAVTRGEILVVEGWRLRRTFATILGADLANEDDPLTGGLSQSGNSFVGDTLILGDAARREIMALFSAELPQGAADRNAVAEFFERLAHRVLLLVRDTARTADVKRIADIAAAQAPAHVEVTLSIARQPLMVGAASLVGVDTFLLPSVPAKPVRIGRSKLGAGDLVTGSGRLDSRSDGPVAPRPLAVGDGPAETLIGMPFLLSAARSEAAAGRNIMRNIWTWVPN